MTGRVQPPGRDRMVATAAGLFGRLGVDGTSFTDVLAQSRAPRGSIYYYFPSGKRELVVDAVRWTTRAVLDYQRGCPARTPGGVLHHFVRFFRRSLRASACRNGCPLAAVAVGSYADAAAVRSPVHAGFRAWAALLAGQLQAVGVAPRVARRLAVTTLAAVEGALILARAEGSLAPLDAVDRQLRALADGLRSPSRGARGPAVGTT